MALPYRSFGFQVLVGMVAGLALFHGEWGGDIDRVYKYSF